MGLECDFKEHAARAQKAMVNFSSNEGYSKRVGCREHPQCLLGHVILLPSSVSLSNANFCLLVAVSIWKCYAYLAREC